MAPDLVNMPQDGDTSFIGRKCEFKIYQDRVKKDGSRQTVVVNLLDIREPPNDVQYAIVVRQVFTDKNVIELTKVDIQSPYLLETFRLVVRSHPTVPSDFTKPFEMQSPFQMLYHFWDEIVEYREAVDDDVARMHVSLLLDFMKTEIGRDREQCLEMAKNNQITFARLWTIFKPGDMVYTETWGQPWLLRVHKVAYEESNSIGKYADIYCRYTDYDDDGRVGQASYIIRIVQKEKFGGGNPATITNLNVFPARFLPDSEALIERLARRGRCYLELQGVLVRGYDGLAAYLRTYPDDFFDIRMADWPGVWMPFTETGRIVLDRKTFCEDQYSEAVPVVSCTPEDAAHSPPIGDPVFCCPYSIGYSLARKEWCKYLVDNIQPIEWNENAFDDLVMKKDQRLLLEALVTSHTFPENPRNQQQQKGKGLVVLLQGTPGSGKTFSAECAAEVTKKALLSTTMGELNKYNTPWQFESRLETVLEYATMWKAIVLLDEADVFLEARPEESGASGEKAALVAVFLKYLEYFSGIVFLTTNRIQVFDAAMKSRLHLALSFHPPDLEMRGVIWEQYLKKVLDLDLDMDEVIHTLGPKKLNGREIFNAINTAQTLARFQKQPLQLKHLQTVLGVRDDFNKSLDEKRERMEATITTSRSNSIVVSPMRTNSILLSRDEARS